MQNHISELIRRPDVAIDENARLVSSGLIDSMALVELLVKIEDITQLRIPPGKVQPNDLDTIALMLATARRVDAEITRLPGHWAPRFTPENATAHTTPQKGDSQCRQE